MARRKAPAQQATLELRAADPAEDERRRLARSLPTHAPRARVRRKVLSYGGGLDSFAMLVDAVQRGEFPDLVIFADVADPERLDPGEWPATYSHMERVAVPYCQRHGIPFKWLGTDEVPVRGARSLYGYLRSLDAMVGRMSRMCTCAAKVDRIKEYLIASYPNDLLEVWIGFEAGEEKRAAKDPHAAADEEPGSAARRVNRFPLIERQLCRCRCLALVRNAGMEPPPGSACVFCPFSTRGDFQRLERQLPEAFVAVEQLEAKAKLTRGGHTIRFAGGSHDPALRAWIEGDYRPRQMSCDVCGSPQRVRKLVGCSAEEIEAACPT